MNKRGRKSSEDMVAASVLIGYGWPRTKASEALTDEQAIVLSDIVGSLPGKFLEQSQAPLGCQLSRHIVSARRLSRFLDNIERLNGDGFDIAEYTKALDARRKESAQNVSICRAPRLTNQSRYRPEKASTEPRSPKPWGDRLIRLKVIQTRNNLGWTQRQRAAFIGVHPTTWIKWESGKTPRADMAVKLADFIARAETSEGRAELQAWRKDAGRRREARRSGRDLHPNSKLGR